MHSQKSDVIEKKPNIFDKHMKEILITMNEILRDYMSIEELIKIIEDSLLSSGKMIRSKLLISTSLIGNNYINKKIVSQCSVVEITHLASLLHDDIIDDSLLRRSHKSIQSKYGKDIAVFAGDYMIARAFNFLAKNNLNKELIIISDTIRDMCNGEVGQNLLKYDENINIQKYFQNISNKTASFFRASCHIGAMNAKLDEKLSQDMMKFGENLGIMFQLRDDLIDIISTEEKLGKEVFKDFREGIYTYPVILGLKDKKYGEKILSFIKLNKKRPLNLDEVQLFKDYLISSKVDILTVKKIKALERENIELLSQLPHNDIAFQNLKKILLKVGDI